MKSRASLVVLLLAIVPACGGGDGPAVAVDADVDAPPPIDAPVDAPIPVPAFRTPLTTADLPLARAAVARLGVGVREACDQCHGLTAGQFREWLESTRLADGCITAHQPRTAAEAQAILDCFRPELGQPYEPHRLGIYTTAASLGWFRAIIQIAYGGNWAPRYADWTSRMLMPRNQPELLTQDEFDIVAEWFARGLPELDNVLTETPPTDDCVGTIDPAVGTHVAQMQTEGWRALNVEAGLTMLGCAGAASARDCLTSYPLASTTAFGQTWGNAQPATTLRVLHQYNYNSSFWTRSSADGRFVAHGGGAGGGATIIDLQRNVRLPASAMYDPGFFPDNSGFVLQGGARPWCRQSVLTANPAQVTFTEPGCSQVGVVGLYQHIGAVHGGDYWAVNGQFVSDNGNGEPSSHFGTSSTNRLTPMIFDGSSYVARPQITIATPNEGDMEISPSARLLLSRASNADGQDGFTLRKLNAVQSGNSYTVTTPVIGRYCVRGGKPAFSYDERWLVYHHWVEAADYADFGYASAADPAFQALVSAGTANIYLLELTTGATHRITSMAAGQRALFPHFRSDGWIYFIVKRVPASGSEVVVASDAALVFEQ
jgi:hypothetical protein